MAECSIRPAIGSETLPILLPSFNYWGRLVGRGLWAVAIPRAFNAFVSLPPVLQVLLGIFVFFVALAVILALLKAWLERTTLSNKPEELAASERDRLRAEIREQERERQQLLLRAEQSEAEIERLQAESRQLQEQNEQLTAERDALEERTTQPHAAQESQLSDGELKERSAKLADELFQFLDERGEQDPGTRWIAGATDAEINEFSQASMQYSDETMKQYRRQFSGRVRALAAALKQRGWWNLEDLDTKERKRIENPLHPITVQAIAERLSEVEYK